jgi:cell division protein FtsW
MINKQVDYKLFFSVFALIIFWMIMISSVSVYSSFRVTSLLEKSWQIQEAYNHFYVIRNIIHVFISMVILVFLVKIPYLVFEKYAKHIFIWNLLLMFYVLFFGKTLNGATWWIYIPWLPSLQPVEFLKLSVIIFLAYFFKKYHESMSSFYYWFIPFLWLLILIVIILWLQPDFGSIMLLLPIMVIMFFVAGARFRHLFYFIAMGMTLFIIVYNSWKYDKQNISSKNKLSYITDRIDNFITDEKKQIKDKTINYQTEQAIIAIWSWGFSGLWFGNSIQKFGYLPEVQWDFVFSVIIEELWFIGGLILLWFYCFIAIRWYLISFYSADLFAKYTSFWITT